MEMKIIFTNRDELTRVCLQDVMYIKADGNYAMICFKSGRVQPILSSLQNIKQLLDEISSGAFLMVGRSHIVNRKYISQINTAHKTIIVADDDTKEHVTLQVSKESVIQLMDAMKEILGTPIDTFDTKNGNMKASVVSDS